MIFEKDKTLNLHAAHGCQQPKIITDYGSPLFRSTSFALISRPGRTPIDRVLSTCTLFLPFRTQQLNYIFVNGKNMLCKDFLKWSKRRATCFSGYWTHCGRGWATKTGPQMDFWGAFQALFNAVQPLIIQ